MANNNLAPSMLFSSAAAVPQKMGLSCSSKTTHSHIVDWMTSMKQYWFLNVMLGDCGEVNRSQL